MMGASKFLLQPRINTASKSPKNQGSKSNNKNPPIVLLNLIHFVLERFNQLNCALNMHLIWTKKRELCIKYVFFYTLALMLPQIAPIEDAVPV